jgi:uncharacterized protein (AIM24 family)
VRRGRRRHQHRVHAPHRRRLLRRGRFILQKLEGTGLTFLHSGGTIVPMQLQSGERLKVDTGCLVAFDPTVITTSCVSAAACWADSAA